MTVNLVADYLKKSYQNYPDSIACADEHEQLTYKQLWNYSEIVSKIFAGNSDAPVALMAFKSVWTLVAVWGAIKAGKGYSVIDPMFPTERINAMLEVLQPSCIAADTKYRKKIHGDYRFIDFDAIKNCADVDSEDCIESTQRTVTDINLVYVMFTSGSTGVPKGVAVNNRSVVDFINEFVDIFGITHDDIVGNQAPWDFDVSVKDIFSAAKVGACLQIIPRKMFSFPRQLAEFIDKKRITTLIWSVSALRILSSSTALELVKPSKVRKVIFSGEVMPVKHYNIWRKLYPGALFANVYGPTEITCNCTYHIQNGILGEDDVIPIGHAFPNEKVFLLDENDNLIDEHKTNAAGEICVSGTAVSMGYYGNLEVGSKVFVQNPLNDKYREIIYRTGDLAFYSDDGLLIYAGRKDNQIKHNGHRIELEEVERALNKLPDIMDACCVYKNEQLSAFVVGIGEGKKIKLQLAKVLPNYMVPEAIVFMEKLPLNSHGKIDRKQLMNVEI